MKKKTFHIESNEQVERLIKHLEEGYSIIEGPIDIIRDGVKISGSYKGYSFGKYKLSD